MAIKTKYASEKFKVRVGDEIKDSFMEEERWLVPQTRLMAGKNK